MTKIDYENRNRLKKTKKKARVDPSDEVADTFSLAKILKESECVTQVVESRAEKKMQGFNQQTDLTRSNNKYRLLLMEVRRLWLINRDAASADEEVRLRRLLLVSRNHYDKVMTFETDDRNLLDELSERLTNRKLQCEFDRKRGKVEKG